MISHQTSPEQKTLKMFHETRDIICTFENLRIKTLLQERDRLYERLIINLFNEKDQEVKESYCRNYKIEVHQIDLKIKDIEEEIIEGKTFRGLL